MKAKILITFLCLAIGANAFASTLRVSVEHHLSGYGPVSAMKTIRATFTDEPLIADVRLDIYAVPQLASSSRHLDALRALPRDGWWEKLDWQLVDRKSGRKVPSSRWQLISSGAEERGPSTGDHSKTVDVRTLHARFAGPGTLPPGDYELTVTVSGLTSPPFLFGVRTGREDDARDAYLAAKAARATDFQSYRALQLERVRHNPANAAAFLELAERSLEHGTLAETQRYYASAIEAMELLLEQQAASPAWVRQQRAEWLPRAQRIRALQRELPEYFSHRHEWRVDQDPASGNYVIRSRRDQRVIREVPPER